MTLWIARDECGELCAFDSKPELNKSNGRFITENCYYFLDEHLFPEITFENSPKQVELKLIEE